MFGIKPLPSPTYFSDLAKTFEGMTPDKLAMREYNLTTIMDEQRKRSMWIAAGAGGLAGLILGAWLRR